MCTNFSHVSSIEALYEQTKVEDVIKGMTIVLSTTETTEVSTHQAVDFVHLTLDVNLKL